MKTCAFVPSSDAATVATLSSILPHAKISVLGIELLETLIGSQEYIREYMAKKLVSCNATLDLLEAVPDARIKFHLHRMCASACRVHHLARLIHPRFTVPFATQFDEDQYTAYSKINNIPLSAAVIRQASLPFRFGGHGSVALTPLVSASYAASLISSAPNRLEGPQGLSFAQDLGLARPHLLLLMRELPPVDRPSEYLIGRSPSVNYNLGKSEPDTLAQRPEGTHHFLFQVINAAVSRRFWQHDDWITRPNPKGHTPASVRHRARYH